LSWISTIVNNHLNWWREFASFTDESTDLFTSPLSKCFPTGGPWSSFGGPPGFFILLKITTLDTNFIKIIKSEPYLLQNHHLETTKWVNFSSILKFAKMLKRCMVGRKNVQNSLWWDAMLPTLRTTALSDDVEHAH